LDGLMGTRRGRVLAYAKKEGEKSKVRAKPSNASQGVYLRSKLMRSKGPHAVCCLGEKEIKLEQDKLLGRLQSIKNGQKS